MTWLTALNSELFFSIIFLSCNHLEFRFFFKLSENVDRSRWTKARPCPLSLQTNSLCARLMCVSRSPVLVYPAPHTHTHTHATTSASLFSSALLWPPPLPSVALTADTSCWFTSYISESWWPRPGLNKMCRSHHSLAYRQSSWGRKRRSDKKKVEGGFWLNGQLKCVKCESYYWRTFTVEFKSDLLSAQFQ